MAKRASRFLARQAEKRYWEKNKETLRDKARIRARNMKEAYNLKRIERVYGLTSDEYKALGIHCHICGKTKTESGRALHVDHNHKTGKVRGLLCIKCNIGLGGFRDDPNLVLEAARYLTREENGD